MQAKIIESLSSHQRDALLAHLLEERKCDIQHLVPTPSSQLGQELMCVAEGMVTNATQCSRIADAIHEADVAVQVGYDDEIWWRMDEISHSIADDIRRNMVAQTSNFLAAFASDLQQKFGDALDGELLENLMEGVEDFRSSDAFHELSAVLADELPTFVHDSLSWSFDTSKLSQFISDQFDRFLENSVGSQIARNICNAEVELAHLFAMSSNKVATEN